MKIVANQMSLHPSPVGDPEVNYIHEARSVDQLKGDLKVFPEELSNTMCHKKDAYPLVDDMKDYTRELPGDGSLAVTENQTGVSCDDTLAVCPGEIRTDLESNFQSYAVSGVEVEHLVSHECSRETDGSSIRDIRVDEGVPTNGKILVEDIADGHAPNDTKDFLELLNVEVEWPVPMCLKSMTHDGSEKDLNGCDSKVPVHQSESESQSSFLVTSDPKDKAVDTFISEEAYAVVLHSNTSVESGCNDKPYTLHQGSIAEFRDATDKHSRSAHEDAQKEIEMKIGLAQETAKIDPSHPAVNENEVKLPSYLFHPQMSEASQMLEQQNLASDHLTSSARIQRDYLESSFASVGPHMSSIAYSGSVAYSGSLSHRSDGSTVSTRSFAFPVLQNEWNFSPVRMRKASRRHLGRRRGWMNGLFCCKF